MRRGGGGRSKQNANAKKEREDKNNFKCQFYELKNFLKTLKC